MIILLHLITAGAFTMSVLLMLVAISKKAFDVWDVSYYQPQTRRKLLEIVRNREARKKYKREHRS